MITTEQAWLAVKGYSDEQLRALVPEILLGHAHIPTSWRSLEQWPEDLLIPLLLEPGGARRQSVLDGTLRFMGEVGRFLIDPTKPLSEEMGKALDHFSALVSLAAPRELKDPVLLLVTFAIKHPAIDLNLRRSLVRAAMTFAEPGEDPKLWESCLLAPELAAYGFEALLRIDPDAPRVDAALHSFWEEFLSGRSKIHVAELTRRTVKARGNDHFLQFLFACVTVEHPELSDPLQAELGRYVFSRGWIKWVPGPQPVRATAAAPWLGRRFSEWVFSIPWVKWATGGSKLAATGEDWPEIALLAGRSTDYSSSEISPKRVLAFSVAAEMSLEDKEREILFFRVAQRSYAECARLLQIPEQEARRVVARIPKLQEEIDRLVANPEELRAAYLNLSETCWQHLEPMLKLFPADQDPSTSGT